MEEKIPSRSLKEINDDYGKVCGQYGDASLKKRKLDIEMCQLEAQALTLFKEHADVEKLIQTMGAAP